jgi:hypothetical protein
MGRGRQKAKNTKVARELKYFSPNTDLTALEREIGSSSSEDQYEDKWADLYEDEEAEDEAEELTDEADAAEDSEEPTN